MMRLHKFIAQCTALSRRAAERAIADGQVRVNGDVVKTMGVQVDPTRDRVHVAGQRVRMRAKRDYVVFHKPKHVLVSKVDGRGRKTMWDLLPERFAHVNAAGRLDYDSEGLIILSNDGEFLQRIAHPTYEIQKVYHVKVQGQPTRALLDRMQEGIHDGGERLTATEVRRTRTTRANTWLSVTLHEGKNRQIRRMCAAIGHPVLKLKRMSIGAVGLGTLRSGEARRMREAELKSLRAALKSPAPRRAVAP